MKTESTGLPVEKYNATLQTTGVLYQLCPKCHGQGIVSKPPYVAGDVDQWSSSQTYFVCDVCNGQKIIETPPVVKISPF